MKIVKRTKCGALWNGKGYLQIGLEKYDVKVVNAEQKSKNSPKYKLVRVEGLRERFLCSLFENTTNNGKTYLNGTIELGFGEMEIKVFKIDDDKRKDKEKSPTSIMFGRLIMEDIDKDKAEEPDPDTTEIDIPEDEIPF